MPLVCFDRADRDADVPNLLKGFVLDGTYSVHRALSSSQAGEESVLIFTTLS